LAEKIIGADEIEKALEKISSKDAKKASEGLFVAAGIEAESIGFYTMQAEKFKGDQMESFFKFLVKQEKGHLNAINSLKTSLEKTGKWIEPQLPKQAKPDIFAKKDWDKERPEGLTAILFALWKEKQAQEFYLGIVERVESKEAKQFFNALANFEKGHAEMLAEYAEESYFTEELIMG